jgi:predicted helicase
MIPLLRSHQQRGLNSMEKYPLGQLIMPTGSGKTLTMIFDAIREQVEKNRLAWKIPSIGVECPECSAKNQVVLDMDQASFFASA